MRQGDKRAAWRRRRLTWFQVAGHTSRDKVAALAAESSEAVAAVVAAGTDEGGQPEGEGNTTAGALGLGEVRRLSDGRGGGGVTSSLSTPTVSPIEERVGAKVVMRAEQI